jgi:hypothetical protein
MGFGIRELMALIGAHTTGKQRFVDLTKANSAFDSTVDIWDTRFCTGYTLFHDLNRDADMGPLRYGDRR